MRRKKKVKPNKNRKKFFIILACYVLTFIITSVVTSATLAWFNGSRWQDNALYMGGPVYIDFTDDQGNKTSGKDQLVTHLPKDWAKLYPGMNIHFEANCTLTGAKFEGTRPGGDTVQWFTTGAVLRSRIMLSVVDTLGTNESQEAKEIYDWIWPQLRDEAINAPFGDGVWIFDKLLSDTDEERLEEKNYFYYCKSGESHDDTADYSLVEVGGIETDVSIGFLKDAIVQIPPVAVTNEYSDSILTFTIVFEALQAFLPFEQADLGLPYPGDTSGRVVTLDDLGLGKPLTIGNSRKYFNESVWSPENGYEQLHFVPVGSVTYTTKI